MDGFGWPSLKDGVLNKDGDTQARRTGPECAAGGRV